MRIKMIVILKVIIKDFVKLADAFCKFLPGMLPTVADFDNIEGTIVGWVTSASAFLSATGCSAST